MLYTKCIVLAYNVVIGPLHGRPVTVHVSLYSHDFAGSQFLRSDANADAVLCAEQFVCCGRRSVHVRSRCDPRTGE